MAFLDSKYSCGLRPQQTILYQVTFAAGEPYSSVVKRLNIWEITEMLFTAGGLHTLLRLTDIIKILKEVEESSHRFNRFEVPIIINERIEAVMVVN